MFTTAISEQTADLSLYTWYFLFLKYTLTVFNVYNATFQKRETMVQELQPQSTKFLLWILSQYLKQGLLKPDLFFQVIRKVNFSDSNNQVALEFINVGDEAKAYLDLEFLVGTIGKEQVDEFRRNCLQFYVTASTEIRNRLPFDDRFLSCVSIFRSQTALYADREKTFPRVWKVCQTLGSFQQTEMANELQSLLEISPQIKEEWSKLSFDDMCLAIASFNMDSEHKMFPNLTSLLNRVRTLPHFNAETERAFSMLTDVKTNKRNRLGTRIVNSICVTRSALKARNETARTTTVTEKHFELMNSENLYHVNKKEDRISNLNLFAADE